jgi:hypothetical protein
MLRRLYLMGWPVQQNYYAIVRKTRSHPYELLTIIGTDIRRIRRELQKDYSVLIVMGYDKLKELHDKPLTEWTNYHYRFSEQAKFLIKSVDINMLERDIKL